VSDEPSNIKGANGPNPLAAQEVEELVKVKGIVPAGGVSGVALSAQVAEEAVHIPTR
jgi:hypothetical protein